MIRRVFWVFLAAMTGIYLTMVLWSLPHLGNMAAGLAMFDLRPVGYSPDEAREVLTVLGSEGRAFYLDIQHPLDTAYPALMALVLTFSFLWAYPRTLAVVLSGVAAAAAGFDYLENSAVATMLIAGPDGISDAMALSASRWTILKSGTVSVALSALLIGLALAGWRKLRSK